MRPVVGLTVMLLGCTTTYVELVGPPEERVAVSVGEAPRRGPPDAPVVIVEFADFECPYCREQWSSLERLMDDYADVVQLVFKHYPLSFHPYARLAAEASLAAHAQGAFWPYYDLLFASPMALTRDDLEAHAAGLGLDLEAFRAALDDGTYAAAVDADLAQGTMLGIEGTPTLFINGRMASGSLSYGTLAAVVEEELALAPTVLPER